MQTENALTRREALLRSALGLGTVQALSLRSVADTLSAESHPSSGGLPPHPLTARRPHFAPRAERVIFLYQSGGISHVDTFDPKPQLDKYHGMTVGETGRVNNDRPRSRLKRSDWEARPAGSQGTMVTSLFPHISGVMDDICLIRSMTGDFSGHQQASLLMHCGSAGSAMPSIGAWLSYGLGTTNVELPAHVVFCKHLPYAGSQNWDSYFLPAYHQGVRITPSEIPIPNLRHRGRPELQAHELKMLRRINEQHLLSRNGMTELVARMLAFKSAYSMQTLVPELLDVSDETDATLEMYGVSRGDNSSYGWQVLMARRLAERGVRFIELVDSGADDNWDNHSDMMQHVPMAQMVDRPIAALIKDLKQRGMYDDTLIVFSTEFGRTPTGSRGREHHRHVFSCWLAGGAVKGGLVHGTSDELGLRVAENPVHVHDLHATILHIMGLDHQRLTYRHAGRDFRLTDVYGRVVHELLA